MSLTQGQILGLPRRRLDVVSVADQARPPKRGAQVHQLPHPLLKPRTVDPRRRLHAKTRGGHGLEEDLAVLEIIGRGGGVGAVVDLALSPRGGEGQLRRVGHPRQLLLPVLERRVQRLGLGRDPAHPVREDLALLLRRLALIAERELVAEHRKMVPVTMSKMRLKTPARV